MSAYGEILTNTYPDIDDALSSYLLGVLDGGADDFDTCDDLYDAVGMILQEVDVSQSEEDVKAICDRLYRMMKHLDDKDESANGPHKVLNAPIHLGQLAGVMLDCDEDSNSIWLTRKDNSTIVNQRKLEKAEARIQKKQDRRTNIDSVPVKAANPINELATASQQIDRKEMKSDMSGSGRSCDIRIENFDMAYGNLKLVDGADLVLVYGRRYGFVGRNGLGKTTLLKMISSAELRIPSHISILHVEQEVVGDETIALDSVLECDEKRESLLREEKMLSLAMASSSPHLQDAAMSSRLTQIYHELEAMESDKAPARAAVILNGLGFTPDMQRSHTKLFSGGWRMRLALARALFSKPDLLLLDEPTNMLDMKAIIWLETYLQAWPSTILVVSHDRQFLNTVATDIVQLHSRRLDTYSGNYEVFHKTRTERMKNQIKEYESQKQYRDHVQTFIDKFRYNAKRASLVQSKIKLLDKLPELKPVEKETDVVLRFPDCEALSPPILQLDEMDFYYLKEKPIFKNVNINASMDSRICIVGDNGAGKTTLLKLLMGVLEPANGLRHAHRNLRIGYFSQHHVDQLDMNVTSVELLANRFPGMQAEQYRNKLGSFGVTGDTAVRSVASLSGGQKSRLAFAAMCMTNPNFLILDEPTNHLDMETIEALGKALKNFKGGVILVSHDERLIRMLCKELWVVGDNNVKSLEGGFDEYKILVEKELEAQR